MGCCSNWFDSRCWILFWSNFNYCTGYSNSNCISKTRFFFSKKRKSNITYIKILSIDKPGQIGKIGQVLGEYNVNINSINIEHRDDKANKYRIGSFFK